MARSDLGSWREVRPGVWQVRVMSGYRDDGRQRVRSVTVEGTESDARRAARDLAAEMGRKPGLARGVTLSEVWSEYLRDRGARLAKKTVRGYKWYMEHVWLPELGERDVTLITHSDVQRVLLMHGRDKADRSRRILSSVLTWAVAEGAADENVVRRGGFELPGDTGSGYEDESVWDDDPFAAIEGTRDVWDARTVMAAIPLMRGLPLEPAWLAALGAGLRVEEALAIRRMDVRRIEVGGRMVTQIAVHHARTDLEERKRPKTKRSTRIVAVMEPFGERLWELASALDKPTDLVCPVSAANQNHRWREYFMDQPTSKHCPKTGVYRGRLRSLPYIPLSRMRATHSTLMQEAGVLDSVNAAAHGHSEQVAYSNYQRADTVAATIKTEGYLRLVK